ncbi:MAG TPA: response regulator [Roseiarcus sp.]|nr:response regulator [Roseiarcus sp.]
MARILLVEDEPLVSAITEEWLVELGHDVAGPAGNLDSAMKLAATPIDGAIVDVSLGRQSGYPAAELLAARGVPFVFATGYGQEGLDPAWRGRPTLMKPFEFETFRTAVERMLAGG